MTKIRKPALGRVADSRLTAEFIASDPRFAGVTPFDPATDVDIVDEMNAALADRGDSGSLSNLTDAPQGSLPRKRGDELNWYPGVEMTGTSTLVLMPQEISTDYGVTHMLAGTIRALDGDGNPLPGGMVRIASIKAQGGGN